jgi:hypothetical protein
MTTIEICSTCGAVGYGNASCRACVVEWPRFGIQQDLVDRLLTAIGNQPPEAPLGPAHVAAALFRFGLRQVELADRVDSAVNRVNAVIDKLEKSR